MYLTKQHDMKTYPLLNEAGAGSLFQG